MAAAETFRAPQSTLGDKSNEKRVLAVTFREKTQCFQQLLKILNKLSNMFILSGFYPSNFVYSCFPPKIRFLYCLLSSVALWGGPLTDTEGKIF